jgi:signal transduction histidine kinase
MRLRLSALIITFIAATMIFSAVSFHQLFKKNLLEGAELKLITYADNIILDIAEDPSKFAANPSKFLFPTAGEEFTSGSYLVEFLDNNGNLLAISPNLKRDQLDFSPNEDDLMKDIETKDGAKLKTFQKIIDVSGQKLGYIIIGTPMTQLYHIIGVVQYSLMAMLFGVIAVLGFGISAIISVSLIRSQKLFLGFASHELRTPLSVISGYAEIASRDKNITDNCRNAVANIKEEADRMNRIISNLLMALRKHTNTESLKRENFNLGELLIETISSIKKAYPNKKVILNLPESSDIVADRDQISMLAGNILENAARNTGDNGEIKVEVSSSGRYFLIKFEDNGKGIKKEHMEKLFDAYYQAEKESSTGFGLGLAICKWVVDSHRGKIGVESEPGKGTTFKVYLPKK